jgi:AAA15 family ATPase/GTPase
MLIEFNVTNYRSFWECQHLRMTASTAAELKESHTCAPASKETLRLLRSAVVYGPNASGKSNLIKALSFMREMVLHSAQGQEGDAIDASPFLFHESGDSLPGEFEVIFIADGVRYQYGFAVNRQRIVHEWLLAYPQSRAQRWFERSWNEKTQAYDWKFSTSFTGTRKLWQEATRANALFLSTAIQLNNEQMKPVFHWFRKISIIPHNAIMHRAFSVEHCQNEAHKKALLELLNAADLSIRDIRCEKKELEKEDLPPGMPREFLDKFLSDFPGGKVVRVFLGHQMKDSDAIVWLPLEEESDGTQKLFDYAGPWLDGLKNGRIFMVDELNNSLHPHILRFILGLFHSAALNRENAQLIFTTHDTSLLDQEIMRRDQIWFMEKDRHNGSRLYPLSDFKPRNTEALERGYLQGRYGAIPFIGEVRF